MGVKIRRPRLAGLFDTPTAALLEAFGAFWFHKRILRLELLLFLVMKTELVEDYKRKRAGASSGDKRTTNTVGR